MWRRRCLFLLLIAAWYYCAEMAEAMGGDIKRTQYLCNGIFGGAVLTLAWSGAYADRGMRSLALLAGYLWLLHPVCGSLYTATATGVTSVCNVVFDTPVSEAIGAGLALVAGWMLDRVRDSDG